jgi:uncharacterized protein
VIAQRSAKSLAVQIAMIWAAVLLILAPASLARAEIQFPALTGRVVDDAHVLSAEQAADLSAKLKALEEKNGRQMVVVTLPSLQGQEISDFGYQLGRKWAIGQKGENSGVLFIIAPNEHKVRIEVGYGLEPVLTDALSSVILQQAVLPKFRSGDMAGGIVDGTTALVEHLGLDDATAKAKVAEAAQKQVVRHHRSSGNPLGGFIALIVIYFVISSLFRRGGGGGLGGWFWPLLFLSSLGRGGRSDWGGGDGGGWGGGGGNDSFGGGGGSFGGGGSSGDW